MMRIKVFLYVLTLFTLHLIAYQQLDRHHPHNDALSFDGGIDIAKYNIKEQPSKDGKKIQLPEVFNWCPENSKIDGCIWLNTA